ncbi:DUF3893 domain-containing protein [Roseomonas sp. M0104]|uniref:DUF3893 domain-containing protein n=1 Tax=Teichococcus coralli TaxID=2545983 RepID=A0A845BB87_9PROT|nr:RNaseH domain-containing protein [Pseudoroseomonas coralli]MXP63908.1 DUF3893 domain-containing protein [Pseudoroseomonas coralli]
MSETVETTSFWRQASLKRDEREIHALALLTPEAAPEALARAQLVWQPRAQALFREIANQGSQSKTDEGRTIPYASLRAALLASIPEASLVEYDLGGPWSGKQSENPRPFAEADCTLRSLLGRARDAASLWCDMVLRDWASRTGVSEDLVDQLSRCLGSDEGLKAVDGQTKLEAVFAEPGFTEPKKTALLQMIGRRLEGQELFEGMGPVFRVVRSKSSSRKIEFETWPRTGNGALYSMVAKLSLETQPWIERPILVIEASRRRWCQELPAAKDLWSQKRLKLHVLSKNKSPLAVEVDCPVRKGVPELPSKPEFFAQAIQVGADLAVELPQMIARGAAANGVFIGIPFQTAFGTHPVQAGASSTDSLNLYEVILDELQGLGFSPLPVRQVGSRRTTREEFHAAIDFSMVVSDMAQGLGYNELSEAALLDIRSRLTRQEVKAEELDEDSLTGSIQKMEKLQRANVARIARAHRNRPPTLLIVSRTERERSTLRALAKVIFPQMKVETMALPEGVHGPRDVLDGAAQKTQTRFDLRVKAWEPVMRRVGELQNCHVLVQAPEWFENRKDDRVNKAAGRYALASAGGNVQYLRPPERSRNSMANYLHRLQAALNDLLLGHSGNVAMVDEAMAKCFPDPTNRPKCVLGLSVIAQSNLRSGAGKGGKVCLATKIDVETGEASGRLGYFDKTLRWTPQWLPFSDLLLEVARLNTPTLGSKRAEEQEAFQQFVRVMIDEAIAAGQKPLILVNSTSASGLWRWLTDKESTNKEVSLDRETFEADKRWPRVRFIRIRSGIAGRVILRSPLVMHELDADNGEPTGQEISRPTTTMSQGAYQVGAGPHFWCSHSYFQMSKQRGLSVYRGMDSTVTVRSASKDWPSWAKKSDGTLYRRMHVPPLVDMHYRLPSSIEASVLLSQPRDSLDDIITLVESLRHGHGHSTAWTMLPAPLSFEAKVRDYITRFAIDEIDEDDGDDDGGDDETPPPGGGNDVDDKIQEELAELAAALSGEPMSSEETVQNNMPSPTEALAEGQAGTGPVSAPERLTLEWVKARMNVPPRTVRLLHKQADIIRRTAPELGWPEPSAAFPSHDEMAVILLRCFHLPAQATGSILVAAEKQKVDWKPFHSMWRKLQAEAAKGIPPKSAANHINVCRAFLKMDLPGKAEDVIFLYGGFYTYDEHMGKYLRSEEKLAHLVPYCEARRRHEVILPKDPALLDTSAGDAKKQAAPVVAAAPLESEAQNDVDGGGTMTSEQETLAVTDVASQTVPPALQSAGAALNPRLAAVAEWFDALAGMGKLDVPGEPSEAFLQELEERLVRARSALAAFEANKPKLVDIAPQLMRLRSAIASLAEMMAGQMPELPSFPHEGNVLEAALEAIDAVISAFECEVSRTLPLLQEVAELHAALSQINPLDPGYMAQVTRIHGKVAEAQASSAAAVAALTAVHETLYQAMAEAEETSRPLTPPPAPAAPYPAEVMAGPVAEAPVPLDVLATAGSVQAQVSTSSAALPPAGEALSQKGEARSPDTPDQDSAPAAEAGLSAAPPLLAPASTTAEVSAEPIPLTSSPAASEAPAEPAPTEADLQEEHASDEDTTSVTEEDERLLGQLRSHTAEARAESQATAAQTPVQEESERSLWASILDDDGEAKELRERIHGLFLKGEYALAWHLLNAAKEIYETGVTPLTSEELSLAAKSGHVSPSLIQSNQAMTDELAEALSAAQRLDVEDPLTEARALVLFASCLEPAFFRQDRLAIDVLQAVQPSLPASLGAVLHPMRVATETVADAGLMLNPAVLQAVLGEEQAKAAIEERRKAIQDKLVTVQNLDFPHSSGNRMRIRLCQSDEPVGALVNAMAGGLQDALAAARACAACFRDRDVTLKELARLTESLAFRDSIDGASRERLVRNLLELGELCSAFLSAYEASGVTKGQYQRQVVQQARDSALTSADSSLGVIQEMLQAEPAEGALDMSGSLLMLEDALKRISGLFRGEVYRRGALDAAVALHGRLAWVPELDFGRSWLPQPYHADTLIRAIAGVHAEPLPPAGPERDSFFSEVLRERLEAGSFVGARMLLDVAPYFSIAESVVSEGKDAYEADRPTRFAHLRAHIQQVRREVQRVQRLGLENLKSGEMDGLLAQVADIEAATIPVPCDLSERTFEKVECGRVQDFNTAEESLAEVESKVRAALAGPRARYRERINNLQGISTEVRASLESLLQRDELVAVQDRLELAEQNIPFSPESNDPHRRWSEFYPHIPQFLANLPSKETEALPERIAAGVDVGLGRARLAFSRIPAARRDSARETFDIWRKLRQSLQKGKQPEEVRGFTEQLLTRLGFVVDKLSQDSIRTEQHRRRYAFDSCLDFVRDAQSMLLPEFGSVTEGHYKLWMLPASLEDGELTKLASAAGSRATIVIATEVLSPERRQAMAVGSMATPGGRRLLVIDEAILLYALTEAEPRPLTLLECAQPFSHTKPFADYGLYATVPPEMFFGREREYQRIFDTSGSCVVFGGRRLGKTALLKHIVGREHQPENGVVVTYLPADNIGQGRPDRTDKIWELASKEMPDVFGPGQFVKTAEDFARTVKAWLGQDHARRVLLLLDEADKFVWEEASGAGDFKQFRGLQRLMDDTSRRFKFVLAGLNNVTRLVQAQMQIVNSPIPQVASDPQRIGPLLGRDARDAEQLIVKPMASMGLRFENQEDIWAVLSNINYYPVLAQTFCQNLLDDIARDAARSQKHDWVISSRTVRRVLESESVGKSIQEKFELTIKLDPRYELITYVIAIHELQSREEGSVTEGLTLAEVQNLAMSYWPKGRALVNRLQTVEALLDEMEGLGVVRRVRRDRYALRSASVLALLGSYERIQQMLEELSRTEPSRPFDPRALRRPLAAQMSVENQQPSPLTYGQEKDILVGESPVVAIFGLPVSDLDAVPAALSQAAQQVAQEGRKASVIMRHPKNLQDFQTMLKSVAPRKDDADLVLVISATTPWNRQWADEALRNRSVRDKRMRVVFVGSFQHALTWSRNGVTTMNKVRVEPLLPWSTTAIDDLAGRLSLNYDDLMPLLTNELGSYSKAIRKAMRPDNKKSLQMSVVTRSASATRAELASPEEFGVSGEIQSFFNAAFSFTEENGYEITPYEIQELVASTPGLGVDAKALAQASILTSILEPMSSKDGVEDEYRSYRFNPLFRAAMAHAVVEPA